MLVLWCKQSEPVNYKLFRGPMDCDRGHGCLEYRRFSDADMSHSQDYFTLKGLISQKAALPLFLTTLMVLGVKSSLLADFWLWTRAPCFS